MRIGPRRVITHDLIHVPEQSDRRAYVPHQAHHPGKGGCEHDQRILRSNRDLPPLNCPHLLGSLHHEAVQRKHEEKAGQRRGDLRDRQTHPHICRDVISVDRQPDDVHIGTSEEDTHEDVAELRPGYRRDLIASHVPDEAQNGGGDDDVDSTVLGRHHPIISKHRMLLTTHGFELSWSHDYGVGGDEYQKADTENKYEILNIALILLSAAHPAKRLPEIIVGAQEEDADHGGLND